MAHKVYIGQQFDSFLAFESFKEHYQNTEYDQFYRRDLRTVEASAVNEENGGLLLGRIGL